MSERTEASDFRKRDRTRRSSRGKTRFHSIVLEGTADSTFTIERFQNAARDTSREQLFLLGRRWRKIVRDNDRAWKNVWFYISDFQCGIYRGISRLKENLFYFLQYTLSVFWNMIFLSCFSSVQCNDISLQIFICFYLKMYLKIQFAENVSYYIRRMSNYVFFNFLDTMDHCVRSKLQWNFDFSYKNYKRRNWKFYRQNPLNI